MRRINHGLGIALAGILLLAPGAASAGSDTLRLLQAVSDKQAKEATDDLGATADKQRENLEKKKALRDAQKSLESPSRLGSSSQQGSLPAVQRPAEFRRVLPRVSSEPAPKNPQPLPAKRADGVDRDD